MIVEIKNLIKQYGDKIVLDIENLKFEEGKKYALIGANGSGKTTLLKILADIEKDYLGNIRTIPYQNADTEQEFSANKRLQVGYMPQRSFGFSMSVLNNMMLAYPLKDRKLSKEKAITMLEKLKLTSLNKKNASKLSGGETQRLALGRLFAAHFELLLLDEPTASMDIDSTSIVEQVLDEYIKENNSTLIFATHSIRQAERFADIIIFLSQGKVVEEVLSTKLLSAPQTDELKNFLKNA